MNVLITGSNGQLGSEIRELAANFSKLDLVFRDSHELDICSFEALQDFIIDHKINAVIIKSLIMKGLILLHIVVLNLHIRVKLDLF